MLGALSLILISIVFIVSKKSGSTVKDVTNNEQSTQETPVNQEQSNDETARLLEEHAEQRRKMIADAVAVLHAENLKLNDTLLKSYPNLPPPQEDNTSIEVYKKIVKSHSGNYELYTRITYSKLTDEINDYAGELGTKATNYFECNKLSKSCEASTIVDKAVKIGVPGYYPEIGFCFLSWDAEKQRMFSGECGAPEVRPASQFNYGENKYFQFSVGGSQYGYLGIDKQLSRIAMAGSVDQESKYPRYTNMVVIYNTDNPSVPEKIIRLDKYIDFDNKNNTEFEFSWRLDGAALLNLQGKFYTLDPVSGEIKPQ